LDELDWKILSLTAKRGLIGATREDLFREVRGLRYEDLEDAIRRLEADGYVAIEWTGPNKFILTVTEKGSQLAASEYEKRLRSYEDRIESQRKATGGVEKV
jgi:predicted transcriptional regulator